MMKSGRFDEYELSILCLESVQKNDAFITHWFMVEGNIIAGLIK